MLAAQCRDGDSATLQELIRCEPAPPAAALVLVIDGSASLGVVKNDLPRAVATLPRGADLTVLLAGHATERWAGKAGDPALVAWLAGRAYSGGIDPVPVLCEALQLAAQRPGSAVVWVTGLHAALLSPVDPLILEMSKRPGPLLVPVSAVAGPNEVLKGLELLPRLLMAPRVGSLDEDLARATRAAGRTAAASEACVAAARQSRRKPGAPGGETGVQALATPLSDWVRVLSRPHPAPSVTEAIAVSDHLSRLWAAAESRAIQARGDDAGAAELAVRYRLITPLSGAVVLERQADYDAHGLDPNKPSAVPVRGVPEPEVIALVLMGLTLVWVARRRAPAR